MSVITVLGASTFLLLFVVAVASGAVVVVVDVETVCCCCCCFSGLGGCDCIVVTSTIGCVAVVVVDDVGPLLLLLLRLFMEEAAPQLWKLAFLLTLGDGRSLPASELEVVWADPRLSTLQELMSRLRGWQRAAVS